MTITPNLPTRTERPHRCWNRRDGWGVLSVVLAAVLAAPLAAQAQDKDEEETEATAGTHLLAEVNLGLGIPPVSYLGPGFSYGGALGIGGKFVDFPLRFYFIVGAASVDFAGDGTHPYTGLGLSTARTYVDIFGGLRLLLPIYDELRVYADFLAGAGYIGGSVNRAEGPTVGPTIDKSDWFAEGIIAAGLQYRWHHYASTGFRVETIFGNQDAELLDAFAGQDSGSGVRLSILVTQTWHL